MVWFSVPFITFFFQNEKEKKSNVNKDHNFYYFYALPTVCLEIRFEKWKEVPAKLLYYDSFFSSLSIRILLVFLL